MDENGHDHATFVDLDLLNASSEHNQHTQNGYGQLDVVFGIVTLTEFPGEIKHSLTS